jgi:tetratricopeptide (TPR) repeat protein
MRFRVHDRRVQNRRVRSRRAPDRIVLAPVVFGFFGFGLFGLLASTASAQSEAVLGRDDAAFARSLYRNGFADLAEGLCKTIEKKGGLSPEAKVGVTALHLDLRFDLAQKETDVTKRKELLKAILDEKEELVRQYPGMKEGVEAAETLPDVYRALGETITVAVQKTSDVAQVAQLQREGEQIYAQAEEKLKQRISELEPDHSSTSAERLYMSYRYNLPRTYYYHSLLYPAGEFRKKQLLEQAVEGFQQFGLDYQDNLLYYDGLIFEGLAAKDLDKKQDAIASFDEAIGVSQAFVNPKTNKVELSLEAADVISRAALQKVLLQTEMKDYAGATATAKAFLEVVPEPAQTTGGLGLAVIAAQAEAELASGDTKSAADTAAKLVSMDEKGRWGEKGREIQAKLIGQSTGDIDAGAILKIAAQRLSRGDDITAIRIAHQGIDAAKGSPKEANVSCEGYLLIGSAFANRGPGWSFEASQAFDTAYKSWPKAEKAPEAVYQAMITYSRLYSLDKRPWFKKRTDDAAKVLTTEYAAHPRASYALLNAGKQLGDEGKFLEAAAEYQKVQPTAASYLEAQFRAGTSYLQQASKLCNEKKEGEADQYEKQAETLLKKSRTDLEAAIKTTMNLDEQARFQSSAFQASISLAQLYLLECVKRPADAIEALKDADEKAGSDENVATAWGLRISAMEKMGKVEDAVGLLDSLAKKNPDSPAIGNAARLVATALDRQAVEYENQKKLKERDAAWKKAATYYSMSGRALAKSKSSKASTIEEVANRLFVLGLQFNDVPKDWDSFVGWTATKTTDPTLFKEAEALFKIALQLSPSYQNQIKLGRALGFQGQFAEAASTYGRLFDTEPIIDVAANPPKFNGGLLKEKPDLYVAYLEWGVASEEAAAKTRDAESYLRAGTIFDNLVRTPDPTGPRARVYWHAKLNQIKNLSNQGKYADAQLLLRDVERTNSELGAPAGLQAEFAKAKETLKNKAPQGAQGLRGGASAPAGSSPAGSNSGSSAPSDAKAGESKPAQQQASGEKPR